jgi:DNA-binding MarR family transcriptional regulator
MAHRVRRRSSRFRDDRVLDKVAHVQQTAVSSHGQPEPELDASRIGRQQLAQELLGVAAYVMKAGQADALRAAAGLDLSLSQLRALHVLDAAGRELALHELAAAAGLSVTTCGRAVDGLVRDGLVTRREDPADRRVKRMATTERAREMLVRLIAARQEAVGRLVASLGEDERAALSAALAPVLALPDVQRLARGVCR